MKHKLLCAVSVLPALLVVSANAYQVKFGDDLNSLFSDGVVPDGLILNGIGGDYELTNATDVEILSASSWAAYIKTAGVLTLGGDKAETVLLSGNKGTVVKSGGVLNIGASDKVDIEAKSYFALYSDTYKGNENTVNVTSKNISIVSDMRHAVLAQGDTFAAQTNSETDSISVINLNGDEIYVQTKGAAVADTNGSMIDQAGLMAGWGAHINVGGKEEGAAAKKVTVISDKGTGIFSSTSRTPTSLEGAVISEVIVNADDILIKAGGVALEAMSMGKIQLNGNADISGDSAAIVARGDAIVSINEDGKHSTVMNGDVRFAFNGPTSGTPVNADIDVVLAGSESSWTGNTVVSWHGSPTEDKLIVDDMTLTLKNSAIWDATVVKDILDADSDEIGQKYIALNNLIIDTGTVNIADTTRGITIDKSFDVKNAVFNGGPLNIASSVNATAVDSSFSKIVNDGTMAFSGETTLDDGIAGNGTVEFASGSTLNATLDTTTIVADKVTANGANLNMVIANGVTDHSYQFVNATEFDNTFSIADNALYNLNIDDEGIFTIAKKSAAETATALASAGVEANEAVALNAIASVATTGNQKVDEVFATIATAVQTGDVESAKKAVKLINPEAKPVVASVSKSVQGQLLTQTANRMGRSGGDVALTGGGVWAQGSFNKSKMNEEFHGYTRAVTAGIDEVINHDVTLGLGYSFANTDVHANNGRSTDIDSNTLFLYAQYKPNQWYINGTAHYTTSKYKENADVLGIEKTAKYNVDAFGANVATGYRFASGATPELGLRYLNVSQDEYVDSFGMKISADTVQYLTSVAGVKYQFDIFATDNLVLRPELRAAATYDIVSDKANATVVMPGGVAGYTLKGDRLSRTGGEFGVGLTANWCGVELSVGYDLNIHKDYTSQTGMVKARWEF